MEKNVAGRARSRGVQNICPSNRPTDGFGCVALAGLLACGSKPGVLPNPIRISGRSPFARRSQLRGQLRICQSGLHRIPVDPLSGAPTSRDAGTEQQGEQDGCISFHSMGQSVDAAMAAATSVRSVSHNGARTARRTCLEESCSEGARLPVAGSVVRFVGWALHPGQSEKSGRSTGRSALPPTPDMALHRKN
jgi:hypothetical protein